MASNFVQEGKTLRIPAASHSGMTVGQPYLIGDALFGIAVKTVATSVDGEIGTEGVWDAPTAGAATGYAVGGLAYFDSANDVVSDATDAAIGDLVIGVFVEAIDTTNDTVKVKLMGGIALAAPAAP